MLRLWKEQLGCWWQEAAVKGGEKNEEQSGQLLGGGEFPILFFLL